MLAQQGEFIGVYPWEKEQLEWAKKFRIVELGSFADIADIDTSAYRVPLAYEWLVGFYKQSATSFDRWVVERGLLLLPKSPKIESEDDYYYDICSEELQHKWAEYLFNNCKKLGLKGLFFDWANEEFLKDPAFTQLAKTLSKRYPKMSYKECIARFFDKLRQKGLVVVANQAYRNPLLLDHIDYDLSESLITTATTLPKRTTFNSEKVDEVPATDYFPVDGSIEGTFENLRYIHDLLYRHKAKGIFHINYAAPKLRPTRSGYKSAPPKEVIHYNFAFAKLFDAWTYTEVPFDRNLEKDGIYFVDLGRAKEEIRKFQGGYLRAYEKGFAVVCDRDLVLTLPQRVFDTFSKRWVGPGSYKIEQSYDTITKSYIPIGRIFLYDQALH